MKNRFFLTVLAIVFAHLVQAQNAWIPNKGYAHVSFNTIGAYNELFVSEGDSWVTTRPITDNTLQFYGSYGINEKFGVTVNLPYKMLTTGSELINDASLDLDPIAAGNFNAMGNIQLLAKYNILNGKNLLSAELLVELPTGSFDNATGLSSGLDATTIAPYVIFSKGSSKYYFNASAGIGFKNNDYSTDYRFNAEFGFKPLKPLWIAAVLDILSSAKNGEVEHPVNQLQTGLYLNNQEYSSYGLKGAFEFNEKFGLNAAFFGAFSGNFVAKSPSMNFGLFYKW